MHFCKEWIQNGLIAFSKKIEIKKRKIHKFKLHYFCVRWSPFKVGQNLRTEGRFTKAFHAHARLGIFKV